MQRQYTLFFLLLVAFLASTMHAVAKLDEYSFSTSFAKPMKLEKEAKVEFVYGQTPTDDGATKPIDIGFAFYFDGTAYKQLSISSNGLIGLGDAQLTSCWDNQLNTPNGDCPGNGDDVYDYTLERTPYIAAFWDDLRILGAVTVSLSGKEPNRVFAVTFYDAETWYQSGVTGTWQVRLYEGSNKIEFYYEKISPEYKGDGASIGLSTGKSNFLSVTPGIKGTATASSIAVNNAYNPNEVEIPGGTLYTFDPCRINGVGDLSHDESRQLRNGDTLLLHQMVPVNSSADFTPIALSLSGPNPCMGEQAFALYVDGEDYSVSPEKGVTSGGKPFMPTITFSPKTIGRSMGILTVVDEKGNKTIYYLAAEGQTALEFVGHVAEGGTPDMKDGDVLMSEIHLRRGQTKDYMPFEVVNKNKKAKPARVTFSIQGISGGQYAVSPSEVEIGGGESASPTITFMPTGIGPVSEILIVDAGGQIFTFNLNAISDGIGGRLQLGTEVISQQTQAFINQPTCVGTGLLTLPLDVKNIGNLPYEISEVDIYRTDTTYRQGQPRYALLRDRQDQLIPSGDYILTTVPPKFVTDTVAPYIRLVAEQVTLPVTVPVGESQTFYLTFISQQPGKRFARAFLHTNDEIVVGTTPDGEEEAGLLTFDLFGRGLGAHFSGGADGRRPGSVIFPGTDLGSSSTMNREIYNTGTCDLTIALRDLRITSGDVDEFAVVSTPQADAYGNITIAPGASATITFSFTPLQTGSRRATVMLRTNDSTISMPGVGEQGVYYLNLFGGGAAGLYVNDVDFGQVLIGSAAGEHRHDVVRLVNTFASPLEITSVTIEGADAGEFMEDPDNPWQARPFLVMPGEEMDLSVVFAPAAGGDPGDRTAVLTIAAGSGLTTSAQLTGEAGTRTMEVNPPAINFPVTTSGKYQRRIVTITNSGTMPMRITMPTVTGPDADKFQVGKLERLEIAPGQQEYLEVTYVPVAAGTVTASLVVNSNATNAPGQVTLNGTSFKTKNPDDDASMPSRRDHASGDIIENRLEHRDDLGVSSVESGAAAGMTLHQSVPNPARDIVEITYSLASAGQVQLALFDAQGRMVRLLDDGNRQSGSHAVRLDIRDLPSGIYHYRLAMGGTMLTRTLQITR